MAGSGKLWFVLLLLRTFCTDGEVARVRLVKTIDKDPDVTPVCPNETLQNITLIRCTISTERSRGEECRLIYRYGHDFEHGCDSRFSLVKENQTIFLHLTNLKPKDSGNYTCECSYPGGTFNLHLNVTVEGDEDATFTTTSPTEPSFLFIVTGVTAFVIIIGVILGFIFRKMCHSDSNHPDAEPADNQRVYYVCRLPSRRQQRPITSPSNTEIEETEPYSVFMQKENVLYSSAKTHSHRTNY